MPADGIGAANKSNQGRLRHFPLTARARRTYTFHRASAIAMSALGLGCVKTRKTEKRPESRALARFYTANAIADIRYSPSYVRFTVMPSH